MTWEVVSRCGAAEYRAPGTGCPNGAEMRGKQFGDDVKSREEVMVALKHQNLRMLGYVGKIS